MNLFIESSQWADERASRAAPEALGVVPQAQGAPYSLEQETYRKEIQLSKRRARRRKLRSMLRVLALLVLVPLLLALVFLATYCATCILGGASLNDLPQLLQDLFERFGGFARTMGSMSSA